MTPTGAAVSGLAVVLLVATIAWIVSLRLRDASIADIGWGPGFVLLAWWYVAILQPPAGRASVIALLVTVWGGRLAAHLYRRGRGRGEDPRYAAMRRARAGSFWWRSLFLVFWLQAALLWIVALPLLAAARGAGPAFPTPLDLVALALVAAGFSCEAVADWQLTRFKANPANRGRVMDEGLWRYSRHPNYFGDAVVWWGIYLFAAATPGGWLTVVSPLLMSFLLIRVSGVALLEAGLTRTKPAYADYVSRTPAFVPWFPRRRQDPASGAAPRNGPSRHP